MKYSGFPTVSDYRKNKISSNRSHTNKIKYTGI